MAFLSAIITGVLADSVTPRLVSDRVLATDIIYVAMDLFALLSLTSISLLYAVSTAAHLANIRTQLEDLDTYVRRESTAFTATCIPLERVNPTTVRLYLIENPNFIPWWLAPGGHVDLSADETPEDVAIQKCRVESGLEVRLVATIGRMQNDYEDCRSRIAPSFIYILRIPSTAKCAKSKHHEYHYDHTYIGIVESHIDQSKQSNGRLQTVGIDLPIDANRDTIAAEISRQVNEYDSSRGRRIPSGQRFPQDFPDRIRLAISEFISRQGLDNRGAS
jgi:ADP-ribose pyrophosphatase YjhB (NUDIX family)